MVILAAAMARGQILSGQVLSIPSSGLPSVVTMTRYCEHGYDETITLVPAGDNGIIAFFSVSDDSVRLGQGRLQGGDDTPTSTGYSVRRFLMRGMRIVSRSSSTTGTNTRGI